MELAIDGIGAYKDWKNYLESDRAEAYFTQTDALWMLGKTEEENQAMKERLTRYNVESEILNIDGIQKKFPAMNLEPCPEVDLETME